MRNRDYRHIVDILFVISLFCMFVLSAIFLISIGANIYSRTMTNMESNFNSRTAVAYIVEKVHQGDSENSVSVTDFQGNQGISISSRVNGVEYLTYIYEFEGVLKELNFRSDVDLSPSAGQDIIEVKDFSVYEDEIGIIHCEVTMTDNEDYSFVICEHSKDSSVDGSSDRSLDRSLDEGQEGDNEF